MIVIKKENFIAEGGLQKCYTHPESENLCIKINKQAIENSKLAYEINYIKKISEKKIKKLDYLFFSKYHGKIETNIGIGYTYDLIRDEDTGEVSKTMADYLLNKESPLSDIVLKKAFNKLIVMMVKYKIVANDLRSQNICCKVLKNGSIEMIIIDGLGHKDLVPFVEWFSFLTKMKIKRRLVRHNLNDFTKQRHMLIKEISDKK